jgi:hypothetical protein
MRLRIALILLALPAMAHAQAQPGSGASWSLPEIGLPLSPIGLPLAPIGLGLPELGLPPVEASTGHKTPPAPAPNAPPRSGRRKGAHARPGVVYLVPAFGWTEPLRTAVPAATAPLPPSLPAPTRPIGVLWLDLQPARTGQVYIDDEFVGTPEEIGGGVTLEAGIHRVAIRAPGYQPLVFNVRIDADRAITYRDTLQPVAPTARAEPANEPGPAAASAAPIPRKPFYFIPGCYLGDVPPAEAGLPASCDISQAITFKP